MKKKLKLGSFTLVSDEKRSEEEAEKEEEKFKLCVVVCCPKIQFSSRSVSP